MFTVRGSFKNTMRFLERMINREPFKALDSYAQEGVAALQAFTPKDSGVTADSWYYKIEDDGSHLRIIWMNDSSNNGVSIPIILQFGHGTGTGGYVAGRDYINPAIQPVFDKIAERVWRGVTSS